MNIYKNVSYNWSIKKQAPTELENDAKPKSLIERVFFLCLLPLSFYLSPFTPYLLPLTFYLLPCFLFLYLVHFTFYFVLCTLYIVPCTFVPFLRNLFTFSSFYLLNLTFYYVLCTLQLVNCWLTVDWLLTDRLLFTVYPFLLTIYWLLFTLFC